MKRVAALWAGYEQRVREESPLAAYARLHRVVPVALVALAGFLLIGIMLPQGRQQEDAAPLMGESSRQAYARVLERNLSPQARRSKRQFLKIRREGIKDLLALARASGLRNCRWDPILKLIRGGVACDGRKLNDEALKTFFWVGLIVSVLCLFGWLFVQLLDSWMLPVWNSRLWYTPVYSSVIGLIMCGPFVMAATYFHRANADYHVPPAEWFPAAPGMQLYLLMVLQATAVVIATVEERPRAEHFATGAAVLVGAGLVTYVLAVGQLGRTSMLTVLVGLEVILGALVLLGHRFIPASGAGRWLSRVFDLSRLLWVAWAFFVGHAVLDEFGVDAGYLGLAFGAVIYGCLLLHLMTSQRSELEWGGST